MGENQIVIYALLLGVGAFALTYMMLPRIIHLVSHKNLMDDPIDRSSHEKKTPTLGGVAFYITLIFGLFVLRIFDTSDEAFFMIPALTILFLIGLKDDLIVLKPSVKLGAQILASGFILLNPSFAIKSLNGFLGVYEIPYSVYLLMGLFIMIVIINAYNLIDGIDGLAGLVGIVVLSSFSCIFFLANAMFYALLCFTLIGALVAFLRFNFSKDRKIFMGDTGSLIVGFVISVLTMKFLELKPMAYSEIPFLLKNAPLIAISILIVPLLDTGRVFALRLSKKRSPFSPDRNHIHHILIDYTGMSHKKASLIISGCNLLFILLMVAISSEVGEEWGLLLLLLFIAALNYLFFRLNYSFGNLRRKLRWKQVLSSFTNLKV
ncbi:glycosyltransferase family 4 protein [Mangrovimonas aestuarii]|uniref:glycosyltransferase family 4 protein n=1 Tax=Mangrovimonas aestuarii TaxID=3018443 RepID=UPI002379B773|nr:MraY family glycosyltransferase [Mangrovimonas aestuarii]